MKTASLWLATAILAAATANVFDFSQAEVGKLPAGWTAAQTGEGSGSVWQIVADETAPGGKALAQISDTAPKPMFNLCVADKTSTADVDVAISFRAMAGKIDQGGGLVWRYRDADNYYLARMNPLEDNFRAYKVVAGKRTQLATADVVAAADRWHAIRVVHVGKRIRCYLDDKLHLDLEDETFPAAGQIGLWTKSDAQTRFAGGKLQAE